MKRKLSTVIAGVCLILPGCSAVTQDAGSAQAELITTGADCWTGTYLNNYDGPINIRAEHNKNSKILIAVPRGAKFTWEECPTRGWVHASYQGKSGWAYNADIIPGNGSGATVLSGPLGIQRCTQKATAQERGNTCWG